ncbi:MAG: serine/threonine-protein kinase [Planctomycetota bacterium]
MNNLDPDATIIGVSPAELASQANSSTTETPVKLVRGGRPQIHDETLALLRQRLQASALVLFVAVSAFWVRSLFVVDSPIRGLQLLVAITLGISTWQLSRWHRVSLRELRLAEVGLFWATAVGLVVYQFSLLHVKVHEGDEVGAVAGMKSCVVYFFGVIILYGTFIPNTWRRAALVVGPMALLPGIPPLVLRQLDPDVRYFSEHTATFEQVSDNILMLVLGVITSAYGAHIINTLREEVFRARQLGQYRLKELLGAGGMGEVYLAEHRLLKRPCAIKLIRMTAQADPLALIRFEREVRATAKLSHPNTIDVYDYGHTDDGTFFYVMEFLPGLNLSEIVYQFGPLPAARAVHILRQTCGALREAHEVGLIHRDIKPANIFAAQRGGLYDVVKLLDFGLVRTTHEAAQKVDAIGERGLSGSIHYMAPEQADPDGTVDIRSDIYSLGATAYFLVTGDPPFRRDQVLDVLRAHNESAVLPPSQLVDDLPFDVEAIILKCLAKRQEDRFQTVREMEKALNECSVAGQWGEAEAHEWWSGHVDINRLVPLTSA